MSSDSCVVCEGTGRVTDGGRNEFDNLEELVCRACDGTGKNWETARFVPDIKRGGGGVYFVLDRHTDDYVAGPFPDRATCGQAALLGNALDQVSAAAPQRHGGEVGDGENTGPSPGGRGPSHPEGRCIPSAESTPPGDDTPNQPVTPDHGERTSNETAEDLEVGPEDPTQVADHGEGPRVLEEVAPDTYMPVARTEDPTQRADHGEPIELHISGAEDLSREDLKTKLALLIVKRQAKGRVMKRWELWAKYIRGGKVVKESRVGWSVFRWFLQMRKRDLESSPEILPQSLDALLQTGNAIFVDFEIRRAPGSRLGQTAPATSSEDDKK